MRDRIIFLIRHGERIDNIDKGWKASSERWDDPHLSPRGHQQASEVGMALRNVDIDAFYVSPFTRTLQTANGILTARGKTTKVFVEPGLSESLNATDYPPGYPSEQKRSDIIQWHDPNYLPIMSHLPRENGGDIGCYERVAKTIEAIVNKSRGNICIVSHGSPIAAAHLHLYGRWDYVGQCTISRVLQSGKNFEAIVIGDCTHLSVKKDLHEVQSKNGESEKGKMLERRVREERRKRNKSESSD